MLNINYLKQILANDIKKLFLFSIVIVFMQPFFYGVVIKFYSNYVDSQITKNIIEYEEVDYEQLCKISDCKSVTKDSVTYERIGNVLTLKNNNTNNVGGFNIVENIYLNKDGLRIFNKDANAFFLLSLDDVENFLYKSSLIFVPTIIFSMIIFLVFTVKKEREKSIITLAGNEALLTNKSMILITENIHHELNTPLEVIDNKVEKIKNLISSDKICILPRTSEQTDKDIKEVLTDFTLIQQSSEQIYNVLEKMKGFKNLRYSNGNKSLYDILKGAFSVVSVSNSNFTFNISKELKKYTLEHNEFKNADLLNIIINHVKNSLDANSNKIHIVFSEFNKNFVTFRIVDNGNGIDKKVEKKIFEPNFSTKTINNGIRGNGLFLNKFIIKYGQGDITLADTSEYGTTFELKVPAKIRG